MKKIIVLVLALSILAPFSAHASGLKLCAKGTKISAKTSCARGETALTLGKVKTAGAANCVTRSIDISGTGTISGTASCNDNESFSSHGGYITDGSGVISSIELRKEVDTNLVAGVTYTFVDAKGGSLDATVQALCCS